MNYLDRQGEEQEFKINLQLFAIDGTDDDFNDENFDDTNLDDDDDLDDDLDDSNDDSNDEEVRFSQVEVDNMIKKRLARINKKEKAFVEKQAKRYGCSEEQFMKKMEDEQSRRDLEAEAVENGIEKKDKIDAFVAKKMAEKPDGKPYVTQEKEFLEAYPDVDLTKLDKSEDFLKFLRNSRKDIDLKDVYENFIDLVGKAKAQAYSRQVSKNTRSTETGRGDNLAPDKSYGCNKTQLALCEANGIKPKDFMKNLKVGQKMMK